MQKLPIFLFTGRVHLETERGYIMTTFYTENHEWIKIKGAAGVVGITAYAADQLGDITFIELPETGYVVQQDGFLCEVESVKAASDIYCPVSGEVLDVNGKLQDSPGLINSDPEDEGWIVSVKLKNPEETKSLLSQQDYEEYIKELGQ